MANLTRYYEAVENIRATGRSPGETVRVTREPTARSTCGSAAARYSG